MYRNKSSKERSDTQLLGAKKFVGMPFSRGLHDLLLEKDIEKKVNLKEQIQDETNKKNVPILFLYYDLIVCPLLLNYNKVYFGSSLNYQTYPSIFIHHLLF